MSRIYVAISPRTVFPLLGLKTTVGSFGENGTITCSLCRRCREALSHTVGKRQLPAPRMPPEARANGLWRGPDPPELAQLSYTEAKVINLARVYVSVKRVFLDRSSYARTSATEAPLYHQKRCSGLSAKFRSCAQSDRDVTDESRQNGRRAVCRRKPPSP